MMGGGGGGLTKLPLFMSEKEMVYFHIDAHVQLMCTLKHRSC